MKKMLFILMALAIATPAMAAVTLTESNKTGTTVTVGYSWDSAGTRPRAFALTLVATGGTITSVTPIKTGENTTGSKGFGIFPGSIVIDASGNVTNVGTPVEAAGHGASALGSAQVICALGSLYKAADANLVPATSGGLFTVVCSGSTTALTVTPETTYRGGVVGEDASQITISNPSQTLAISFAAPETISTPTVAKTTAAPAIAGRVNAVRSETFVASGATSSLGHSLEYQFNWGDGTALVWGAATQTHTFTTATTKTWTTNVTVQARCIADPGVTSSVSAAIAETGEAVKSTAAFYSVWASWSRPNCWAYQRNCHGDADGAQVAAGKGGVPPAHWTGSPDLGILSAAWQKSDTVLATVTNGICADFDRAQVAAGKGGVPPAHRVGSPDLGILSAYWQKADATNTVCPNTDYNYWTN